MEEVAKLFRVEKNTVRNWIKSGLETVDDRRQTLVLGRKLSAFLHARRERARQRCKPGQFYCLRCRAPRDPVSSRADYVPITPASGNLKGTCLECGSRMYRRVSLHKLAASVGHLEVQLALAEQRIEDTSSPCLNSDLVQEHEAYANAQLGK